MSIKQITIEWLFEKTVEAKFQIPPTIIQLEYIVKEYNYIIGEIGTYTFDVDNHEEKLSQANNDMYFHLSKLAYNKFIGGHTLIDGNKRMYKILSEKINSEIEYEELM